MRRSAEDYLEAILCMENSGAEVHSVALAARLGVSKPCVSRAMSALRNEGYIAFGKNSALRLTQKGLAQAREVYARHTVITRFFMMSLGLPQEVAERDACRFEHEISPETLRRMEQYIHHVLE